MSSPESDDRSRSPIIAHGPYSGWIDNTYDALLVYEAAARGIIPRITRRLTPSERALIGSGTIFVYDERESGIKRWTDGYTWSPSRALNNFFLYREVLNRAPNSPNKSKADSPKPEEVSEEGSEEACCYSEQVRFAFERDRNLEKTLVGSLRNSYPFKVGGMMKKTISFCVKGVVSHHIVSYYRLEDVLSGRLIRVSQIPEIQRLVPGNVYMENLDVLNFPPKTMKLEGGIVRYIGEADDIDKSRAGRPKDHPHVRAEEKAREHNFGYGDRGRDYSGTPMTYSRYEPYYHRKPGSSGEYPDEDDAAAMYYYQHRGRAPSRRPGGHVPGYSGYPYPYDPYTAYHQWYAAQQAAYYQPYPPAPYGYPYPYQSYYPDPRYAHRDPVDPRSPADSVEEVERATERVMDPETRLNGRRLSMENGSDERTSSRKDKGKGVATVEKITLVALAPEERSMSPLTPPADDDDDD